jgi:hypothetical protein
MLLPNVYTNDGLRINESHVLPHIKNYRIPKNNIVRKGSDKAQV